MSDIICEVKNGFGVITLNRESHLNALTLEMIRDIYQALNEWEKDANIYGVIIKSNPESKAFCAGGDIRWIYKEGMEKNPHLLDFFRLEYTLNYYIANYPKPYIALMNGITMGGGVGISMHSKFSVATDKFMFAMPETAIGFFPDIGASYLLSNLANNYGIFLGLTGKRLNAFEAQDLGLINYVIDETSLTAIYYELLSIESSAYDIREAIHSVLENYNITNRGAKKHSDIQIANNILVAESFKFNNVIDIIKSLENSNNKFANDIIAELNSKSPLSLAVTLRQLNLAKILTLKECLKMDFCLVQNFLKNNDFYEGVRALLIDKDNKPLWQPSSLQDISEELILQYFSATKSLDL